MDWSYISDGETGNELENSLVKLDGKRSYGRPKRIWNCNIKMDIRAVG
jgi:hypothetical protein